MTTAEVDLRSGPGQNYNVVRKIPEGIKVHVVGTEGEWLRVESKHGNQPGYIEKRFTVRQTVPPPTRGADTQRRPGSSKCVGPTGRPMNC